MAEFSMWQGRPISTLSHEELLGVIDFLERALHGGQQMLRPSTVTPPTDVEISGPDWGTKGKLLSIGVSSQGGLAVVEQSDGTISALLLYSAGFSSGGRVSLRRLK